MPLFKIILYAAGIFLIIGIALLINTMKLPARIKKAEELLNEGDYNAANSIVKIILEKKKDYIPARYLRAQIYIMQSQYLLAIVELNSILQIPNFQKFVEELDIHYKLADLYQQTQQWQKEIEEYKSILKFNPEDVKANHKLGHALFNRENFRDAKELLTKAISLDPRLIDCYMPIGIAAFNLSEYETAEKNLLSSIETPHYTVEANYFLGLIYKIKKNYDTAIKMFETAKKDNRFFLKSVFNLAEIFHETEHYEDAIQILESGIRNLKKNDDESLAYRYLLAECYEMMNKIKEAIHHWDQIMKMNPNFRDTRHKLDEYQGILQNENIGTLFTSTLADLQPLITEMISRLNYNIISKQEISHNEFLYRAFNIKRSNEPPILIYFNRTTKEITEGQVLNFQKQINDEKCRSGIYITTGKFSLRAKTAAGSRSIEILDANFINKTIEKIHAKTTK